ncbi:NAD(P)-binding protein [Periconia macrospinosa]|uniref:NAD(P)-binding protein n=1 Tax=Periconia macrospinosa TaxID=97972 RepID=A0A2V1DCI4_9PLEO|nr:NAD(P)-binding protein [Periconia macrospinosa]
MAAPPPWTGFTFTSKLHSAPTPKLKSLKLSGPFVVVVTGASRGIGAETAKTFARAGATGIIITATSLSNALISTKKEIETISPTIKVTALDADVSDPESALKILEAVKSEHSGRLDVLINNAAIVSTNPTAYNGDNLAAIDTSQFVDPFTVNVIGKLATIKALMPLLLATNGAKTIINMTSAASQFASNGALGYNLSQLVTNRLTEAIAESYGSRGVLAYGVHPGIVPTMPRPIGEPEGGKLFAVDDVGLCGPFLLWLVQERREWLSGRYVSANWDVDELVSKKDVIVREDKLKMRMVV